MLEPQDLPVLDKRRAIVDRLALRTVGANDCAKYHRRPLACLHRPLEDILHLVDKILSLQQILRRVARQGLLGKYDQVDTLLPGALKGAENPGKIAFAIPDDRIELGQGDLHDSNSLL